MEDERVEFDRGRPRFIKDPDTGRRMPLERDERLQGIMNAWWDGECTHPGHTVSRVQVSGGSIQIRNTCLTCGEATGSAIGKKDRPDWESLPLLDGSVAHEYKSRRREAHYQSLLALAREQLKERGWFSKEYTAYLDSPEWERRRQLVFKRCNETCEGCGERRATQVHHITYENFKNEFLFELLGLCRECHERIHEQERQQRGYSNTIDLDEEDHEEDWTPE